MPSSAADLPTELLLRLFTELDLPSLLIVRGVCTRWNTLIPLTHGNPIRMGFFHFYLELARNSVFVESRPWILGQLKARKRAFVREAYIEILTSQLMDSGGTIPEDFRLWILEWPERATLFACWPGIPRAHFEDTSVDPTCAWDGVNWLAYPQVSAVIVANRTNKAANHRHAVLIHTDSERAPTMLFMDNPTHMGREHREAGAPVASGEGETESGVDVSLNGMVYIGQHASDYVSYVVESRGDDDFCSNAIVASDAHGNLDVHSFVPDWLSFQRHLWTRLQENGRQIQRVLQLGMSTDHPLIILTRKSR